MTTLDIGDSLHRGDVLKVLPTIPDASVQVVIADPPYFRVAEADWDRQWKNQEAYLAWTRLWAAECMRVLRPDGLCFIFGQPGKREHVFLHLMSELCRAHQFHDLIIWDRVVGYNERRDSLTPAYEMILVLRGGAQEVRFYKDRVRTPYSPEIIRTYLADKRYKDPVARREHLEKGKFATNILPVPSLKGISKEKVGHPSQKPLALIEKLVLMSTGEGDTVLDPFLGSGTTAVVAQRLGRRCIGIEKDPAYCRMALARIQNEVAVHRKKLPGF